MTTSASARDHARLLVGADDGTGSQAATRQNLLDALKWVATEAGPDDPVFFAFFGDGGPLGDLGDRHCYFAADSTFKGRDKDAVAAADVAEALKGLKSRKFAVYLDANFRGYTVPNGTTVAEPSFGDQWFAEFRGDLGSDDTGEGQAPGRVVFTPTYASGYGKAPMDGPDHDAFTMSLLEGLKGAADADGDEADGVVTVDELATFLNKKVPELAHIYGKTEQEMGLYAGVLTGPNSHFMLSRNPGPYARSRKRLAQFEKLVQADGDLVEVAEEGRRFLARTPRLNAQRELRKDYQKLADGDLSAVDFLKARAKILDGTKLARAAADNFAGRVIDATKMVLSDYYLEENQGELVSTAVHKLYRYLEEKVPDAIEANLATARNTSEDDLKQVLIDARTALGAREDLEKDVDVNVALYEMLHSLDPYTAYIDPETVSNYRNQVRGNFIGVGFQVRKDAATDYLLVVTPIKGSPAYRAGVLAGDLITAITRDVDEKGNAIPSGPEHTSTKGLTVGDAIKKILGAEGSKVRFTVRREGSEKPLEFEIARGRVQSETVFGVKRKANDDWDYMLDPDRKIGYIRISQLLDDTYDDVVAAVAGLKKQGLKGLVLDLRFNPGGTVKSATDVSDLFMDDGVIVSERRRGASEEFTRGKHEGSELDFPMVVLINDQTASGAEIVGACLQDHHRAYVVGERSFGDGSMQNINDFGDGQIKLTTATFWRPSGKNLYKRDPEALKNDTWGVKPDLVAPLTEKERGDLLDRLRDGEIIPRRDLPPRAPRPDFKDVQLEKALDYLTDQIRTAANNR